MSSEELSNELSRILKRIQTLITTAENLTADAEKPGVSDSDSSAFRAEADARRTMADSLMLQYAIKEVGETADDPTKRTKPMISTVLIGQDSEVISYVAQVLSDLAKHCRCRLRMYTSWTNDGWNAKVYGFESDVRYLEIMYTSVRLHMLGILLPRVETHKSLEDNAYVLHNSGYNWLQISEKYGWKKWNSMFPGEYDGTRPPADMKVPYYHKDEGWQPATQVGSRIKRAYHRACAERGEEVQKIAANGTESYRKSAAYGYVSMIHSRLRQMASNREPGSELVLRSRVDDIEKLFREDNPDLYQEVVTPPEPSNGKKVRVRIPKYKGMTINEDAYRRGANHAKTADLNAHARTTGHSQGELGA